MIRQFIEDNEYGEVQVSQDVSYNLRDVIDESYRLFNGQYEDSHDSSGLKKIFYRMIWVIYRTIMMSSDVDMKDINMRSLNGKNIKGLALVKMAVRSHLIRTRFGKYIDKVMSELVWFGSSITKRVDGRVETVDLRNYVTQPNVKDPQERSHAERVYYSYDEMMSFKKDWEDQWGAVEDLWEKMQKENIHTFTVIEFWTWFEENGETHKGCIKYLDNQLLQPEDLKEPGQWEAYIELDRFITPYKKKRNSKRMIKKLGEYEEMFPYEQVDLFDVPGRWLGFGCAELLAGLQEHYNEQFNLKRKKDILDLRGIFVHKYSNSNNSLTQDMISNLETGDVIQLSETEDFQRLIIDTKTSEFLNNIDKLYELMRLTMGVTAQGTGEELPSSTTATVASLNQSTQQTTYDYVRERIHHFIVDLFTNGYFEDIIEEITEQEVVAIVGDPTHLTEIDEFLTTEYVNKKIIEYKKNNGVYPSEEEATLLKELIMETQKENKDMRFPEIKKEILKELNYYFEFYVNNETFDKRAKIETLTSLRQDPNMSQKAVSNAILDLLNENPQQYEKSVEEKEEEAERLRQQAMLEQEQQQPQVPQLDNAPIQ